MLKKTSYNISTLFGLGFIRFMPGTFGSIVGLLSGFLILKHTFLEFFILQLFFTFIISTYLLKVYQEYTNKKDSSDIIIDEYIGQQVPFIFLDITLSNIIMFFIFFRFFDILKLFPANFIDKKYKNCMGVMLDDIIAGIQTTLLICIINNLLI